MDNASVCDVLARAAGIMLLQKYGLNVHALNARIRCMAHVVNLIVQALLAALDEADDPDKDDYYIANKHLPFHYDPNDDDEVQEMEAEGDKEDGEGEDDDDDDEDEEFEKLLNMPELLDEELDKEVSAKVANLSEVKKVSLLHRLQSNFTHMDVGLSSSSSVQLRRRFVRHLSAASNFASLRRKHMIQNLRPLLPTSCSAS